LLSLQRIIVNFTLVFLRSFYNTGKNIDRNTQGESDANRISAGGKQSDRVVAPISVKLLRVAEPIVHSDIQHYVNLEIFHC
jgi:hypothetical protein